MRAMNLSEKKIPPNSAIIIVMLFGIFFLSSCAHTGEATLSFSPEMGTSSNGLNTHSAIIIAESPSDEMAKDLSEEEVKHQEETIEDESFEEDPFEEDPFEDDPFEKDPFENAGADKQQAVDVADPLEGLNRVIFQFNDKLYYWVVKPIARGYRATVPSKIRIGFSNFFINLLGPLRFVNCLFQGKGEAADAELVRFVMNSTVGVLGFGNPAQNYPRLVLHDEDFGQTFGSWGIGHGCYIVLPFFGPSTLRDSAGLLSDYFLMPVNYIEPTELAWGTWGLDSINSTSFRIGDYESLKDAALDPYEAFRNAYIQNRKKAVSQ